MLCPLHRLSDRAYAETLRQHHGESVDQAWVLFSAAVSPKSVSFCWWASRPFLKSENIDLRERKGRKGGGQEITETERERAREIDCKRIGGGDKRDGKRMGRSKTCYFGL